MTLLDWIIGNAGGRAEVIADHGRLVEVKVLVARGAGGNRVSVYGVCLDVAVCIDG